MGTNMKEEFKPIVGYDGLYEISNYGRVYSVRKAKFLRPKSNGRGYMQIELTKDKNHKMFYVHRLVASAFLENPDCLPEVNHKDENVQNNNLNNLEWITQRDNLTYGTRIERIIKHLKKAVIQKDMNGNVIQVFDSLADAERLGGYKHSNVSNCCKGKLQSAYGFRWEFAKEV